VNDSSIKGSRVDGSRVDGSRVGGLGLSINAAGWNQKSEHSRSGSRHEELNRQEFGGP